MYSVYGVYSVYSVYSVYIQSKSTAEKFFVRFVVESFKYILEVF